MPQNEEGDGARRMNPLIIIAILFALLLALTGYACIVVGGDADRAEEAYLERRRAQTNRREEPAERER